MKADRGPPTAQNIREAITAFALTNTSAVEKAKSAVNRIVKICGAPCSRLFIPVAEGSWGEPKEEFIENWVADHLSQLQTLEPLFLSRLSAGEFDYWPNECRCDLLNEIAKAQRRLAKLQPVALDQELLQDPMLGGRLVDNGSCKSSWNPGKRFQLTSEDLVKYCEENRTAFQRLGTMGEVIVAFAKSFPLRPSAKSIVRALAVKELQARRYIKELPKVMQKEIAAGNAVVRGLYALLQTGDDTTNS